MKKEEMIIETFARPNEDVDLLCNTLNAQAGRFMHSDYFLYCVLVRAQAAIVTLANRLKEKSK